MALHFSREEFAARRRRACDRLAGEGLYGLVVFRQESMYYLTGYDTSGYSMFQGMYLGADGALALLTRSADKHQSRITSTIPDIRIWQDRENATPGDDLRDMLADHGCRGKRLGIEYHAYGLTAQRGRMVDAALAGFCETADASDIVRLLRLVKSEAELDYVRASGRLADAAMQTAVEMAVPGTHLGAVYGEMMNVIMRGDGDPSASRWPMGSGEDALMIRYHTGHGRIQENDQVQIEFAASYRHYHTALMNVLLTGKPDRRHQAMFDACREALLACEAALKPGATVGEIFDLHARVLSNAGYGDHYMNACGYTMGATYPPTWMDFPMFYTGNRQVIEPNMVFFLHMVILDHDSGLAMSAGETSIVTEDECEQVTHAPEELVVN